MSLGIDYNLCDELDPFHDNARHGWHDRSMRESRARVMGNLCDVSDAALLSMIGDLLNHDPEAIEEVVIPLSKPAERLVNTAERLLTGRRAEEFFLANAPTIINVPTSLLLDRRIHACGYDFAIRDRDPIAIEVKGLKQTRGTITFTDREWSEAKIRRENFWLVVVGNLESTPVARLVADPTATLEAKCKSQTTITASWHAPIAVK